MTPTAARRAKSKVKAFVQGFDKSRPRFDCPCCGWHGIFLDVSPSTGRRLHAECPRCGSLERHRLQSLVLDKVLPGLTTARMSMLHFAPEPFFRARFKEAFGRYETADIDRPDVDHRVDMQALPLPDATFDIVYASHVMEHIADDMSALRELRRILRPGGLAILPVPIVAERTVEYAEPNPLETMHVRAPGPDYFDRYREVFRRVDIFPSSDFPTRYQCTPLTPADGGTKRHADYVPVCHA